MPFLLSFPVRLCSGLKFVLDQFVCAKTVELAPPPRPHSPSQLSEVLQTPITQTKGDMENFPAPRRSLVPAPAPRNSVKSAVTERFIPGPVNDRRFNISRAAVTSRCITPRRELAQRGTRALTGYRLVTYNTSIFSLSHWHSFS